MTTSVVTAGRRGNGNAVKYMLERRAAGRGRSQALAGQTFYAFFILPHLAAGKDAPPSTSTFRRCSRGEP